MGGLAGVRRGRTTGDLTGGGGRSVGPYRGGTGFIGGDPRRSGLSRLYGPQEREVPAGGWAPPPPGGGYSGGVIPRFQGGGGYAQSIMHLIPSPGRREWRRDRESRRAHTQEAQQNLAPQRGRGGYSGGVIPRFQAGGAPRRTGYAPSSYQSPFDQYGRAWGFKRRHLGQSFDPREQTKSLANTLQNYWGQPPGGGYSGGVVPRFQQGRALTPRAVKRAWGYSRSGNPAVLLPSMYPDARARSIAKVQAGEIPHFGPESGGSWGPPPPGGWQEGGQLEDPLFPVESELADESPWYPDEEIGYEAAAPMQGGFDIFGRSGG